MGDIKTAAEIAAEKAKAIGEATEEERLAWKYVPEGEKLAANFLKDNINLMAELTSYEVDIRKYVLRGISEVLVRNINLPRDEASERTNKRAMETLKNLKNEKVKVENIYSGLRRIFSHYQEQGKHQKQQAYEQLKAQIGAKLQQALQQQMGAGAAGMRIDVERQPQFQEEWRKLQAQFDSQYTRLLEEYKQELLSLQ